MLYPSNPILWISVVLFHPFYLLYSCPLALIERSVSQGDWGQKKAWRLLDPGVRPTIAGALAARRGQSVCDLSSWIVLGPHNGLLTSILLEASGGGEIPTLDPPTQSAKLKLEAIEWWRNLIWISIRYQHRSSRNGSLAFLIFASLQRAKYDMDLYDLTMWNPPRLDFGGTWLPILYSCIPVHLISCAHSTCRASPNTHQICFSYLATI